MKEAKWESCNDPVAMLYFARGRPGAGGLILRGFLGLVGIRLLEAKYKSSVRKLRLFNIACWRRLGHLCSDPRAHRAIEMAEVRADGQIDESEVNSATQGALQAFEDNGHGPAESSLCYAAWVVADEEGIAPKPTMWAEDQVARAARDAAEQAGGGRSAGQAESRVQCDLLRDLYGPLPFRPLTVHRDWLTWHDGTIPRMASAIYEDQAYERLPILADALEDAGCTDAEILSHLRGPGPHVRGCWVIDLLLAKS
jgi:hypothetical protein